MIVPEKDHKDKIVFLYRQMICQIVLNDSMSFTLISERLL